MPVIAIVCSYTIRFLQAKSQLQVSTPLPRRMLVQLYRYQRPGYKHHWNKPCQKKTTPGLEQRTAWQQERASALRRGRHCFSQLRERWEQVVAQTSKSCKEPAPRQPRSQRTDQRLCPMVTLTFVRLGIGSPHYIQCRLSATKSYYFKRRWTKEVRNAG